VTPPAPSALHTSFYLPLSFGLLKIASKSERDADDFPRGLGEKIQL
jgi:hypothetical protein